MTTGQIQAACALVMAALAVAAVLWRMARRDARVDTAIERLTDICEWLIEREQARDDPMEYHRRYPQSARHNRRQ